VVVFFCVISWSRWPAQEMFANELMAKDPDQRHALLQWHKSRSSDVASVLEDSVSQPWRDMEDIDEPSAAKRPRLE
jgi:hypothetical protein